MERMSLKPESARTLWLFAAILALISSMIPSPSGGFFVSVIAALIALPPAILARGRGRLGGALALALALVLAATGYPAMRRDQAAAAEYARIKRPAGAPGVASDGRSGGQGRPADHDSARSGSDR